MNTLFHRDLFDAFSAEELAIVERLAAAFGDYAALCDKMMGHENSLLGEAYREEGARFRAVADNIRRRRHHGPDREP